MYMLAAKTAASPRDRVFQMLDYSMQTGELPFWYIITTCR